MWQRLTKWNKNKFDWPPQHFILFVFYVDSKVLPKKKKYFPKPLRHVKMLPFSFDGFTVVFFLSKFFPTFPLHILSPRHTFMHTKTFPFPKHTHIHTDTRIHRLSYLHMLTFFIFAFSFRFTELNFTHSVRLFPAILFYFLIKERNSPMLTWQRIGSYANHFYSLIHRFFFCSSNFFSLYAHPFTTVTTHKRISINH